MDESGTVRVLVVDDQEPFRAAATAVVTHTGGFTLVGAATSGEDAVRRGPALRPDLVLMDLRLPGVDGVEAARRLRAVCPDVLVVVFSTYYPGDLPAAVRTTEVAGYFHKSALRPALLRDIWRARLS
ncbi:response regulator [Cryptosporangium aurantiacum]|uniref:Response regulator receiver domain-containing protein n=1 Tax=Cryptosporangium aurantiacum TaxID=134849 RepID=A0A1M7RKB9_9ACTN|nr:response regulator transcription factor [Cryptosporangium aurantiacum]SHN46518.1 Response regulator receiver domain-containing protein [Cryptosporangium aurantiacum]